MMDSAPESGPDARAHMDQLKPATKLHVPLSNIPVPYARNSPEAVKAMALLDRHYRMLNERTSTDFEAAEYTAVPDEEWMADLAGNIRDPSQFQTGIFHRYLHVWEEHVKRMNEVDANRPQAKRVMRLLREGAKYNIVHPDSPCQQRHPKYKQNRAKVKIALAAVYGEKQAEKLIDRPSPGHVFLPNQKSFFEHEDFVEQCFEAPGGLIPSGKVQKWWYPDGKMPRCVHPLGVDVRAVSGKRRLFYAQCYANLFGRYVPFSMETLDDVVEHAEPNCYGATSDIHAGYHGIHIADRDVDLFGFVYKQEIWVWSAMPFGFSPGPRVFTEMVAFMFNHARREGLRMTLFIDDRLMLDLLRERLKHDVLCIHLLEAALGGVVSVKKMRALPHQAVEFLGLIAQLAGCEQFFEVPAEKMAALLALMANMIAAITVTPREVAGTSGKLNSFRRAVPLAPLFCRDFWNELSGVGQAWDAPRVLPVELIQHLKFLIGYLPSHNGKRFWKRRRGVVVVGDASAIGGGARLLALNADFSKDPADWDVNAYKALGRNAVFQTSYTREDCDLAAENKLSSALREIRCLHEWLQAALPVFPNELEHAATLYFTDSEVMTYDVEKMQGNENLLPAVRDLWLECMEHDMDLEVEWIPRETPMLQGADWESKEFDASAWAMSPWHTNWVLNKNCRGLRLDLDCFADNINTKAKLFLSRRLCPGTSGVNSFLQSYNNVAGIARPLCWVNGPFQLLLKIVNKIKQERADCILIAPDWMGPAVALIKTLPVVASGILPFHDEHGHYKQMFIAGARVDPRKQKVGHSKPPLYNVWFYLIIWPESEIYWRR